MSRVTTVKIFIETILFITADTLSKSFIVQSQLLISYTYIHDSLVFVINGYQWNSMNRSKIQIRVTNYPSRERSFFFFFSHYTCCRCIRLDRIAPHFFALLIARRRPYQPIARHSSNITPLAPGIRRGMEKFDLDENFRVVGIANGRRSFFETSTSSSIRAPSHIREFALIQLYYLYFPSFFSMDLCDSHDSNPFSFFYNM